MRVCRFCGKEVGEPRGKICRKCRWERSKIQCMDCRASISKSAIRCRPCDGKAKMFDKHPNWTGGKRKTQKGYVLLTDADSRNHPNAQKSGILEHIKVMSEFIGRPLKDGENVHHINGIRDDNRIENLELWSVSQPKGQRLQDKIDWAIEFLAIYGYKVS